jgi:alpha-tubulin suppressor-like RCC1 family protein
MKRLALSATVVVVMAGSVAPAIAENATWVNATNVSVSGASLLKTGAASAWDAGAASKQVIRDGYGYVDFIATETNTSRACGLSVGDPGQTLTEIDYAVFLQPSGVVSFYQSGSQYGGGFSYVGGDHFRVEAYHGQIRYLKNGVVLLTSNLPPAYPLRVDAALYTPGATLTDVKVGNVVWTTSSGVSPANGSLVKSGTTGWNAGAYSSNFLTRPDGFVEFTAGQTTTSRIAGLGSHNPAQIPQALADIEYGIHLRADGLVTVREGGVSQGDFGGYVGNDRFRVEIRGNTLRYLKNGGEFYSHSVTPTYPLRLEAAFETTGAELQDLALEELVWSNEVGVTISGSSLVKTASSGWNASAASSRTFASGDAWLEFTALEVNSRRAAGLNSGTPAATLTDIDFAIELTDTGTVRVLESGVVRWDSGTYAHGDRLRVEVREGQVKYLQNGTALYTSTVSPSYPLRMDAVLHTTGATLVDAAEGDWVLVGAVGLEQRGSVLRKQTGTAAYDAGAVSTRAFNTGFVEVTASDGYLTRAFGLSHGDLGTSLSDIDYAVVLTNSGFAPVLQVVEKGIVVLTLNSGHVPGDRFRVEVTPGLQVKYYKNGGSPFYTSVTAPVLPLRADTSFWSIGSSLLGVVVSGSAVTDQLEEPVFSPVAGAYSSAQAVAISAYSGASIHYTTDGSTPTDLSPVYSSPVAVGVSLTLKAMARKSGLTDSPVASGVYTLQVVQPQIAPASGPYTTPQTVTVTCSTAGATIHYTSGVNPADPTESDPVVVSGGTLPIDISQTLKVKAWKTDWTPSTVASAVYTLQVATPVLNPGNGSYSGAQSVTVTTASPGATLHYSLTGAEPTTLDPTVASGGTVLVSASTTLKVKGVRSGWTTSDTAGASYMISNGTVAAPTMNPPTGAYPAPQTVHITTTTPSAVIRYTIDGTEPGFRSAIYSAALVIDASTTLKAKAFKADWTPSASTTAAYGINTGGVSAPTFTPGSGTYPTHQSVTISVSTPGASIYYTTDGKEPGETDFLIPPGGPVQIEVPRSMRLRARAYKTGLAPSVVRTVDYRLEGATEAGTDHSMALKADGTIWAWGSSSFGKLGNGTTSDQFLPVQVAQPLGGLTDPVAIAAGFHHSLAIGKDGRAWGWGRATANGSNADSWVPTLVSGTDNSAFVQVVAGWFFSAGLKSDGTVWIWGMFNGFHVFGPAPERVDWLSGVSQLAAKGDHVLALKTDGTASGTVWAWGLNSNGQLGDGTTAHRLVPVRVTGLSDVVSLGAGRSHSLATTTSGSVYAWGTDNFGQLGDGTIAQPPFVTAPIVVAGVTGLGVAGFNHSLMVAPEDRVLGWGANFYGQIGNGLEDGGRAWPDLVATSGLSAVAAAELHSIARGRNGTVWTWGHNANGRLGVGSGVVKSPLPLLVNLSLVDNSWLSGDADGDGLSNDAEIGLGTDPVNADTNGDGLLDGAAVASGMSATDLDMDDDGLSNASERQNGTDPFLADTDGDGVSDALDAFPLDPTRTTAPPPIPGDVTAPIITLIEPKNAVPVP